MIACQHLQTKLIHLIVIDAIICAHINEVKPSQILAGGMQLDIEKRFDRIEVKLDQLTDTVAILARIDERLVSSHKRLDRHEVRLDLLEGNIRDTETTVARAAGKGMVIERAAWILFAAAITVVGNFL